MTEIIRLIMLCVGRGDQGDAGQGISDEILMIQRNNNFITGMMEEWHKKLHNNSSPDDMIICEVGAKSCNIKFLRERLPSWIKIPLSIALPFGTFEAVLSDDINKDIANKISRLYKFVMGGDLTKLKAIQDAIRRMNATSSLTYELKSKMRSSRIPWPRDEGEERRTHAWQAIKKVGASKWNERSYVSCRKLNLNHDDQQMAVLIQEVIRGDYAFVIHTKNLISGDVSEINTEVTDYPSKNIGLYGKQSIIFRSDSNDEDLEGYVGAGLYNSVLMDEEEKVVLDYSNDGMIVDKSFQISLFSKIAEGGKIIEGLYGCPQDIEGVVKGGVMYVVQARPQIYYYLRQVITFLFI